MLRFARILPRASLLLPRASLLLPGASLLLCVLLSAPDCALLAQTNDDCTTPLDLGGNAISIAWDNSAATTDSPDLTPLAAIGLGGLCETWSANNNLVNRDLWYSWTPAAGIGVAQFSLCFDTLPAIPNELTDNKLVVYDSTDCLTLSAANAIACDDDFCADAGSGSPGTNGLQAITTAHVTAGVTYLIQVGSWGATSSGVSTLEIQPLARPVTGLACAPGASPDDYQLAWGWPVGAGSGDFVEISSNEVGAVNPIATLPFPTTSHVGTLLGPNLGTTQALVFDVRAEIGALTSPAESCAVVLNPPPGDECAGAAAGGTGTVALFYDPTGLTTSPEVVPSTCPSGGHFAGGYNLDAWYLWTAATTATRFAYTNIGDPVFGVYNSCADAAAGNAIDCEDRGASGSFTLTTVVGQDYIIRVGNDSGIGGTGTLEVTALQGPVENLSCSVVGDNYTLSWDNPASGSLGDPITIESDEPGAFNPIASLTNTGPGGSYTGTLLPGNAGLPTNVNFGVVYSGPFGDSDAASCTGFFHPVAGDECVSATVLPAGDQIVNYDNGAATTSPEPVPNTCPSGGQFAQPYMSDVWYAWTAASPITFFEVAGLSAPSDPVFAVYDSCAAAASGTALDCEDRGAVGSFAVPTVAGQLYFIRIGIEGANPGGPGVLTIQGFAPPTHDDCTTAIHLGTGDRTASFATHGATASTAPLPLGPCPSSTVLPSSFPADIWYAWTSSGGVLFVSVEGLAGITDPVVALYESCADADLGIAVDCADRGDPSTLQTNTNAGTTYLIRLSHETSATGVGELLIQELIPAPNDECATATDLGSGPVIVDVDLRAATLSPEPGATFNSCPSDVFVAGDYDPDTWYSWTAHSDVITFSFVQDNAPVVSDPVFAIYDSCLDAANGVFIDCQDNGPTDNEITITVTIGNTYLVRVADDGGIGGIGSLMISGLQDGVANLTCLNTIPTDTYQLTWMNPAGSQPGDVVEISSNEPGVTNPLFVVPWPGTSIPLTSLLAGNQGMASFPVTFSARLIGSIGISQPAECSIVFNPDPGDECSVPIPIGSDALTASFDLTGFTDSPQGIPPAALCSQTTDMQSDIWLEWTAAFDAYLFEVTSVTNTDDAFALYESCAAADAVVAIACNDGGSDAAFEANVTIGQTYLIRIGEDDGTAAPGTLTITRVQAPVRNVGCTTSTVPDTAVVTWSNPAGGSSGDLIEVRTNEPGVVNPVQTLLFPSNTTTVTLLAANQGGAINLNVTLTYISAVGTSIDAGCSIVLNPPANDDCANAIDLGSGNVTVGWSNLGAATDSLVATPVCGLIAPTWSGTGGVNNDIWYRYTAAPGTTNIDVALCSGGAMGGELANTKLVVYDDIGFCPPFNSSIVGCDDDSCVSLGLQSAVNINVTPGNSYLIAVGGFTAGDTGSGVLQVGPPCAAIPDFTATFDCATQVVTLAWTETDAYTSYTLTANGTPTMPQPQPLSVGSTNGQIESAPLLNTTLTYELTAHCPNGGITVTTATVSTIVPANADNLILNLELPSDVDSAAAILASLTAHGESAIMINSQTDPCFAALVADATNIWVCEGTFPDATRISAATGLALFNAVQTGKNVYLESSDHWEFDTVPSPYDLVDGIELLAGDDGDDSLTSLQSVNAPAAALNIATAFPLPVIYNQDQATAPDYNDQLVLATPATDTGIVGVETIFRNFPDPGETSYVVGAIARTASGQATISSSFEFGGFGTGAERDSLLALYLQAMPGTNSGPAFQRGDCNVDGAKNIADPIRLLNFLFPQTPNSLLCESACDANDDGSNNIADAVTMLSVLFPTGPPIPWLAPDLCGVDPTGLGCARYPHCP